VTAPGSFLSDVTAGERVAVTVRAVGVGAVFSVVGAATADSVFRIRSKDERTALQHRPTALRGVHEAYR